ncbi:MAG: L,D-transpeptidase, partial [Pyrinomonadaceae bacterium]
MIGQRKRRAAHGARRLLLSCAVAAACALSLWTVAPVSAQAQGAAHHDRFESERSDKLTGGKIERAEFEPGQPDINLTLNVPSFRLTLWQNGREVRSYWIGVGMKDYPIYIGEREANEVIWNPAWIPPASEWVSSHKGVSPGEIIKASDPRNPLGKLKIPLGDGYLIHQAAKTTDPGNLVSHGCVRVLRTDLYDLAEKITAARSLPVTRRQIALAKAGTKQLLIPLDTPLPVEVHYDTLVVEDGTLHVYPDVYDRRMNTVQRLRDELVSSGANLSRVDDETLRQILAQVSKRGTQFVVDVSSIESGRALEDGRTAPVIPT